MAFLRSVKYLALIFVTINSSENALVKYHAMPTLYYFFISMEIKVLNDCCAEGYVSRTVSFADGWFL